MDDVKETVLRLDSDDPEVTRPALERLIALGSDRYVVDKLVSYLKASERPLVRMNLAYVLGEIKDARATPALVLALRDENDRVRNSAVQALRQFRSVELIPDLFNSLGDKSNMVRANAALALGELGDLQVAGALVGLISDPDEHVRTTARQSLDLLSEARSRQQR